MKQQSPNTHCGYVAIVGRPNVGKSTLLNHLVGQKISITSRKPQTTRHRMLGIYTKDDLQVVFVDTPGLHLDEKRAINRLMNKAASSSLTDVDLVIFLVDATIWNDDDAMVLEKIKHCNSPVIMLVNKVDKIIDKSTLLPHLDWLSKQYDFEDIFPASALKGTNIGALHTKIAQSMPPCEFIYPEDYITDRSMRFLAAEAVREKLIRQLGSELPYSMTVEIEKFESDAKGIQHISAVILVERKGQKRMVIGKGGSRLKQVGQDARLDLEKLYDCKVFLQLWVKVKDGWADDEKALKSLGFDE